MVPFASAVGYHSILMRGRLAENKRWLVVLVLYNSTILPISIGSIVQNPKGRPLDNEQDFVL